MANQAHIYAELAKQLGLNKNAPSSTQRALLRHSEKFLEVADGKIATTEPLPEQLSFDANILNEKKPTE